MTAMGVVALLLTVWAQSPAELMRRESALGTTGKLQDPASVESRGRDIALPERVAPSTETSVVPVAEAPSVAVPPEPAPDDADMDARLAQLHYCRASVAGERKVATQRVRAGGLVLRWTVERDGTVSNTDVVALRSTDAELLACIKREMADWRFAPSLDPAPRRLATQFRP